MDELLLEKKRLDDTISIFHDIMDDLGLSIESISNNFKLDPDYQYKLVKISKKKLQLVERSINKPYFARIDFKDKEGNIEVCYLSKVGISDFDNNLVTIDWRVPIASLYYDCNLGNVSYLGPNGRIDGELLKKRQYEIEEGKLIQFTDVDTVSNDEILKPYLDVNADNRLKNIVSSIQKEQNQVIRKDISDNIIVQGVAGSGKTTVALHRIAYLAYHNRDKIFNDQYMVIGPNKFFVKYISNVLPDLDVDDVLQVTYQELVNYYLEENIVFKNNKKINKIKLSLKYIDVINEYVKNINPIPVRDFILYDFPIISYKRIFKIYEAIDNKIYPSIEERIDKTIIFLSKYIQDNKEQILDNIIKKYDMSKCREKYELLKKDLNNNCIKSLEKYFTIKSMKVSYLYYEFLDKAGFDNKKRELTEDDLPGILYFCYLIKDRSNFMKYRHTVIDEAQDYSEMHFYVLNKILRNSNFSIFGDLAQSIYGDVSINDWNVVKEKCFNDMDILYLKKSYRTTVEIMNEANRILSFIGLDYAEPVIRHGNGVAYKKIDNYDDVKDYIEYFKKQKYSSIAVVTSNDNEYREICNYLEKENVSFHEINSDNLDYESGLCVISRELVKGLEFDAVIILNASEDNYSSSNILDMKKLYVAMTRPLHELIVMYSDNLTKPLL